MLDPDISTSAALRLLHTPVVDLDHNPLSVDRRRFLQLVGMGMGAGLVAGPGSSLLDAALPGFDPSAWAAGPIGPNDGILLIIGMYGGNDGLNTVVPLTGSARTLYDEQHGQLAVDGATTLGVGADAGLHPELTELKRFWDAGQLAIVEGVGHGLEDFSHFSSMARWMSGTLSGIPDSGWIGRWLDGYTNGSTDLFAAAEVGHSLPLHTIGRRSSATTVPTGQPGFGVEREWRAAADRSMYAAIRDLGTADPSTWLGRVGVAQGDQLTVASTLSPILNGVEVPENEAEIPTKLEVAARLINANLGMRVITAGFGDFDSHAGQPDQHPVRMRELNTALQRFFATLDPAWGERVTVMTFSEFGRTSWANDGRGTDHGSSAPQFVLGANVKGGFYGERPSLAGLERWERPPTTVQMLDYYGSVIDGWLGGGAGDVLGSGFTNDLKLFSSGPTPGSTTPGSVLGQFVALSPRRIYDTRDTTGGPVAKIGPGETVKIQVAGLADVPAGDVKGVAVNISSIRPTETTFLTAYPTGFPKPFTASLNPRPGAVVPNMSVVGVGSDGSFSLYNEAGTVDVSIDLMGFFRTQTAARITPLTPSRILDTRNGVGASGRVRGGTPVALQVAGQGGVPATGVEAVVLNLTSAAPTQNGWVTAWPSGEAKPLVANLSYIAGQVIPNMVMCKVGADGKINLEASAGELDLIGDVVGCFTDNGSMLSPVVPLRLLDTRTGTGAPAAQVPAGGEVSLTVTGQGGVPADAKAVVLNVTGIRPAARSFLTIYPEGEARPTAASLNPPAGSVAGNLVVAKVGSGGKVRIYNDTSALHLTADLTAYFI